MSVAGRLLHCHQRSKHVHGRSGFQLYVLRLPSSEAWEHVWIILPKQISEHLDSLPICRRLTMIWVRETHLSLGSSSATNRAAHWHALHWGYFRQSSHFGALITGLKALCEPKHAVSAFNDGGRSQSTQTPKRHPWKVFIRESRERHSAKEVPRHCLAWFCFELDMMKQSTHGA